MVSENDFLLVAGRVSPGGPRFTARRWHQLWVLAITAVTLGTTFMAVDNIKVYREASIPEQQFRASLTGAAEIGDVTSRKEGEKNVEEDHIRPERFAVQPGAHNCTTYWYEQKLDHFNFYRPVEGITTFKQRVLIYDKWWGGPGAPIFFYTGNEGPVENYADHTGLMWEHGRSFQALLIFMEHRYFGESMPFGEKSIDHVQYLSQEQAMTDYATYIYHFKQRHSAENSAVIAFGGSYGGMLSAAMRLKYPHLIQGAISSSSPFKGFPGLGKYEGERKFDGREYWQVVTRDAMPAAGASEGCADNVRKSWRIIFDKGQSDQGRKELSETFRLCKIPEGEKQVHALAMFLLLSWDTMAMGNYPYPSSYMTNGGASLPAWPVRAACEKMPGPNVDETTAEGASDLLRGIRDATAVYNNVSGDLSCYTLPDAEDVGGGIWDYFYCTEMLPQETYFARDGKNDMFWPAPFDMHNIAKHCNKTWGVRPEPLWVAINYGNFEQASNIVFVNGLFDPWSALSIQQPPNNQTVVLNVTDGAHHFDLMFSTDKDPESVKHVREQEVRLIRKFIHEYEEMRKGI